MARQGLIAVTGANRGIGAAIARRLAAQGWTVGCVTRSGALPDIAGLDGGAAERLVAVKGDVTQPDTLKSAFGELSARGRIYGLVNNAGIYDAARSSEASLSDFTNVLNVNATGTFAASQAVYPHLKAEGGLIVNIGSFFEREGIKGAAAYCASKAAVGAITRCLAVEWARDRIRVLNVAPGYVATDLNEEAMQNEAFRSFLQKRVPVKGRAARADEIGRMVGALFDADIPYLTGETIFVEGGQSINQ